MIWSQWELTVFSLNIRQGEGGDKYYFQEFCIFPAFFSFCGMYLFRFCTEEHSCGIKFKQPEETGFFGNIDLNIQAWMLSVLAFGFTAYGGYYFVKNPVI